MDARWVVLNHASTVNKLLGYENRVAVTSANPDPLLHHLAKHADIMEVMTLPPPLPPMAPHLSDENLLQLAAARTASRKVRRAISVASFDGWTIGAFAALTLLFGITVYLCNMMGFGLGVIVL